MIKKSISLILVFAVILCIGGCGKSKKSNSDIAESDNTVKKHSPSCITLLFNKTDSLNPYTAKTENNRLVAKLIFEPLVKTDNNLQPVNRLAESVKLEGRNCTVTLKNAVFSDQSPVTASDVVYSYNLAKGYGGLYTAHLYEVTSVSAVSDNTVSFNLSMADPYFANLLDFPILKSGSDKITDSDGTAKTPIGCGRYTPADEPFLLKQNASFFGTKGDIKEIKLIHAPDSDSVSHYIEIGATDFYYSDFSGNNIVRMSGSRTDVNLNTLIYLGVNTFSPVLKEKYLRYAVSSAIDRKVLCKDAFFDSATPASGYFSPALAEARAVQSLKPTSDLQITVDNLSKMGYNDRNQDGYFVDRNGNHIVLRLLVNKESQSKLIAAKLIAEQLKSAGIEVKITECGYAEFVRLISANAFDLYLGEISVLPNFDLTQLVIKGGSVAYGLNNEKPDETKPDGEQPEKTRDGNENNGDDTASTDDRGDSPVKLIYDEFRSGTASISDVAGTLITEMPQIPLLFKHGILFSNESIQNITVSECDIFFSAENYKIK